DKLVTGVQTCALPIYSLAPLARPLGLPAHVAVSLTAPFSTVLRFARNDKGSPLQVRGTRNDEDAPGRSSSHVVLMFFVRQTWSKSLKLTTKNTNDTKNLRLTGSRAGPNKE